MADASAFALWKFKTVEGILRYVRPMDFNTTKYDDGKTSAVIRYDLDNHTATIEYDDKFKLDDSCSFSKLSELLKMHNMYLIRSESRNESSGIPFDANPDKI